MVRVIGVGPPRSGTKMLAQALSVVRPTHHECPPIRDEATMLYALRWLRGDTDPWSLPLHEDEVAFFLTFHAPEIGGKVVHLWRPAEDWVRSAMEFGLYTSWKVRVLWLSGLLPLPGETVEDKLLWAYRAHHSYLLEDCPGAYVTTPDRIVWPHLFEWLGWTYSDEELRRVRGIQRGRPNRSDPAPVEVVVDQATREVEGALEAVTPFTREEARHPL